MPNLNKVMLMGNLTRDPELRHMPNGTAVVTLGLAVNRRWRNQQDEMQEETTFVDCEAFGKQAEVMSQYLRKGRPVYLEGRLRLDQWQDKEGNNRSKMKVVVDQFQFIDSRSDGEGGPGGSGGGGDSDRGRSSGGGGGYERSSDRPSGGYSRNDRDASSSRNASPQSSPPGDHVPVDDDDIPF